MNLCLFYEQNEKLSSPQEPEKGGAATGWECDSPREKEEKEGKSFCYEARLCRASQSHRARPFSVHSSLKK